VLVLLIYTLVNAACWVFFRRRRRAQFRVLRHAVLPSLGALMTAGIFAAVMASPGDAPLSYIPIIVGVWLVVGVAALALLWRKLGAAR
jgi:amino acid transporter